MTLPHLYLLLAAIGLVVIAYADNKLSNRLPTMTLRHSSYGTYRIELRELYERILRCGYVNAALGL